MKYKNVLEATFLARPNRFIAICLVDEEEVICHVKNTGRCKELFIPGVKVFLQRASGISKRKTLYDVISVYKGEKLINIDSQVPNDVVYEAIKNKSLVLTGFENLTLLLREKTFGSSRFDLYIENGEKKAFVEVKGVTLETKGVASFPDAPSQRAIKHLKELQQANKEGYKTFIVFLVQMNGVQYFEPNKSTHPEFARELKHASENGVEILCFNSSVTPNSITIHEKMRVHLI